MDKCQKRSSPHFEQVDFNMVIMIGVIFFIKIVMDHLFVAIVIRVVFFNG